MGLLGLKLLNRRMITIFKHINTREKQKYLVRANGGKPVGSGRKLSKTRAERREKIPSSETSLKISRHNNAPVVIMS